MPHPYTIPNRVFALLLAVVLLMGAVVHLIGYDRGLPLYESIDERNKIHIVYAIRGLGGALRWPGYPPGILYVNHAAQLVAEGVTGKPATECACEIVHGLRLIGIVVHLLAITGMAFIGRWFGGNLVGLLVPAAWLFNVNVLSEAQYAFPQTYEHLFYVVALGAAIVALTRRSIPFVILSTVAGLGAVVFKYTQFPVLGLGVGVALWHLWRQPAARGRWGSALCVQFALIATCAAWLWFGYDAGRLWRWESGHEETQIVRSGDGWRHLLQPILLHYRVINLANQAALPYAVFVPLILGGTALLWRRLNTERRLVLFAMIGLIAIHTVTLWLFLDANKINALRQNFTVSSYTVLWVGAIIVALVATLHDRGHTSLARGVFVVVLLAWLTPYSVQGVGYVLERRLPVTYAQLPMWAGQYLPFTDDAVLVVSDNRPFTAEFACYSGPHIPQTFEAPLTTYTLAEWVAAGAAFIQVDNASLRDLEMKGVTDDYLSNMTLIASFPADGTTAVRTWRRGDEDYHLTVYHTLQVENAVDAVYGGQVRLVGYTKPDDIVRPGDEFVLWLYWQPTTDITADYAAFLHLVGDDETELIAQGDGPLNSNPFTPTLAWTEPNPLVEQTLFPGRFEIPIPPDLAQGTYKLRVGVYDRATGNRLTLADGSDSLQWSLVIGGE